MDLAKEYKLGTIGFLPLYETDDIHMTIHLTHVALSKCYIYTCFIFDNAFILIF